MLKVTAFGINMLLMAKLLNLSCFIFAFYQILSDSQSLFSALLRIIEENVKVDYRLTIFPTHLDSTASLPATTFSEPGYTFFYLSYPFSTLAITALHNDSLPCCPLS